MLNLDAPRANCADRLDLVDATYTSPGGAAATLLKEHYCKHCPIATACLTEAMLHHEGGVWGGTTPHIRTRAGAPASDSTDRHRRMAARASG